MGMIWLPTWAKPLTQRFGGSEQVGHTMQRTGPRRQERDPRQIAANAWVECSARPAGQRGWSIVALA